MDEELADLNAKLAKQVMKKFLMFHAVKWALILGISYASKKYLKEQDSQNLHVV